MPFRIKLLTILLTVESLLAGCFSIRLGVYNLACMILLGLIIYLPWQKLQIILWMLLPLGAIAESIYLQNHQYHFILCNIIFAYHLFVLGGECIINRNGRIAASGPYSLSLILSLVPTYFAMAIPAESAWTVIVQPSCGLTIAFISWLLLQPEFSWVMRRPVAASNRTKSRLRLCPKSFNRKSKPLISRPGFFHAGWFKKGIG